MSSHIAKVALVGAAFSLVAGCAWWDRTFGTNFTGDNPPVETASLDGSTRTAAPDGGGASASSTPATGATTATTAADAQATYEQQEIVDAVADFFGITAQAAGQAVERIFRENGRPVGYIRGEEVAGPLASACATARAT
jgi:hypothetical protein